MHWLKFIFITALVVIFVGTSFIAIFGAARVLTALFKAYVFKAETCEYMPAKLRQVAAEPAKVESVKQEFEDPERECKIDYNRAKEDIAEGLAMFIISAPIALVLFRKTKNLL